MLKNLKLTNFQRHEALTLTFTAGLNLIRGLNEAGKSTIFCSIAYAFYGARALPLSLEETVTWGKPAASLRVALEFDHLGIDYTIVRRKSGAELVGPDNLRVSGHSEVTTYMEKLFNASAAVAVATLIAGQNQLKESLDGRSVSLIETLSNMGLIDELVTKIQTLLPSGNTKIFESRLDELQDLIVPVADFSGQELDLTRAVAGEAITALISEQGKQDYGTVKMEAVLAAARVSEAKSTEEQKAMIGRQLAEAKALASRPEPVSTETCTVEVLTTAQAGQQQQATIAAKWKLFQSLPVLPYTNRGNAVRLAQSVAETQTASQQAIRKAELEKAAVRASIITQTACGLCGKDLSNVPEVVRINAEAEARAKNLDEIISAETKVNTAAAKDLQAYADLVKIDNSMALKLTQLTGYVIVDETALPATVVWTSGEVLNNPVQVDYAARIAQLRAFQQALAVHQGKVEQASRSVGTFQTILTLLDERPQIDPQDLLAPERLEVALTAAQAVVAQHSEAVNLVVRTEALLDAARHSHTFKVTQYESQLAEREYLTTTIAAYGLNNGLIKKLREVRPVVARKLWGSVLSAVSTYFSGIRGTPSIVTRDDARFLIDGKSIAAFSGSTKDALGLAIRITLQKTFLGSIDFMMVDEPGAAADTERETAMLGLLSTCGYRQVVLVTHSELGDAVAANVIPI